MPYGVMVSTGGSNPLGLRSSRSGATKWNTMEDKYIQYLQLQMARILFNLELLDKSIDSAELQNEQFVLDFYDKLNKISVRK